MTDIAVTDLRELFLKKTPLIDVRAPIEFERGSAPGAVNLPLMDNEQRALVGTTYKKHGQTEALRVGYELVSGKDKESKIESWIDFKNNNPTAVLFCYRGGLRSKISQEWLFEAGIECPRVEGGYKKIREFLVSQVEEFSSQPLFVLAGLTGSGKTKFLDQIKSHYPVLDLESIANHRGSAFGATQAAQPSQSFFENSLATSVIPLAHSLKHVLVEDESRMIGQNVIPEALFSQMRRAPVLLLEETLETRVHNIFSEYILNSPIGSADTTQALKQFEIYRNATNAISKKLGGLRTQEILSDLETSRLLYTQNSSDLESNKVWIEKLLVHYYDPLYTKNFERRSPQILERGRASDLFEFLSERR